jgi:hypothetical protein
MAILVAAGGAAGADGAVVGQVTDLRGRPLPGVVLSAQSWQSQPLGSAKSDAQGRFRIAVTNAGADITLYAEPPGYARFALTGFKADGQLAKVPLTRVVDAAYLQELAAETDAARFAALAADLLSPSTGTVGETLPMETIYPVLGALRPRLRAYVPQDLAQLGRSDLPRNLHHAMLLLAWWSDPQDDALIDAWSAGQRKLASRPSRPCRGATIEAAWRAWEALHFQKEGYGQGQGQGQGQRKSRPTPWAQARVTLAKGGDRAIVSHEVRYAHWGYSQRIVVVRTPAGFEARLVIAHEHWHGRD